MHKQIRKNKSKLHLEKRNLKLELQTSSNFVAMVPVSYSSDSLEPIKRLDRFRLSLLFTLLVDPLRICATLACFTISNAYEDQ